MIPFIPNTPHVNPDRKYAVEGGHFIKFDSNFGRGRHEADILALLGDAWYAPELYSAYPTGDYFCIRMEKRDGETLENLKGLLTDKEKAAAIQWLFTIFNDLSARQIVHGDLNESNVLFDRNSQVVSIIDWEMARMEESLVDVYGENGGLLRLLEYLK